MVPSLTVGLLTPFVFKPSSAAEQNYGYYPDDDSFDKFGHDEVLPNRELIEMRSFECEPLRAGTLPSPGISRLH